MTGVFNAVDAALDLRAGRLRQLDVGHMASTPPPPVEWLVEGVLVKATVTMLAGREGTGKSALALALAAACGTKESVAGLEATADAQRVLYVDAENGPREIHRRLYGLEVRPEALGYLEAEGFDLLVHLDELRVLVEALEPDVIVLDSLRSLAPSWEENESAAAEQVLAPLRKLARDSGAAILLIHHAGKADSAQEYRGSSGIGAGVEIGLTLGRDRNDPHKRTRRCLSCWKMRPAAEPEPLWLALDGSGGTLQIVPAPPFDASQDKQGEQDQLGNRMVAVLKAHGGPLKRKLLMERVPVNPQSGTAGRALASLEERGLVEKVGRGLYTAVRDDG